MCLSAFKYWDVNNVYGWAVSQKLPVNDFKLFEKTCQFNKDFIKSYNEESDTGYYTDILWKPRNAKPTFFIKS